MACASGIDDDPSAGGGCEAGMRMLVTGATGFVGRALIPYLAWRGTGGVATGRQAPAGLPAAWAGCTRGEVLVAATNKVKADVIVHLEVRQHVPRPQPDDIADFERVNVGNTREWLDWAGRVGVRRFVFLSSIKAVRPTDEPCDERTPGNADEPYGRSKAAAEDAVRDWAAGDPERAAVILRAAPVYGAGNEANLAAFARQVMLGKPCLIGDGLTRKSVVSLTNLAAAILFSALHAKCGCEVFNVSDRETRTLADIAGLIARLAGAPPPRSIPATTAGWVARIGDFVEALSGRKSPLTTPRLRALCETTVFPCDKLVAAGFDHPHTTEQGLAEMVAWLRQTASREQ